MEKKFDRIELRAIEDNGKLIIEGVVNDYNWSKTMTNEDGVRFVEKTPIETWTKAINGKVKLLINHDDCVNVCKSMTLTTKDNGVVIRAELIEQAKGLYEKINKGAANSFSFGFRCIKDSWNIINGLAHRTLEEIELFEVSILTDDEIPAYNNTFLSTRALSIPKEIEEEIEREIELMELENFILSI